MKKLLCLFLTAVLLLSLSMPIFAGSGASSSDTITLASGDMVSLSIPKGKTLWYTYSNPELVANGEFSQKLIVNCTTGFSCSVTYFDGGIEKTIAADDDGFINVVLNDKNKSGDYTFAITNTSDVARPGRFTVTFESLPQYVLTGIDLVVGDNNLVYDSTAPTALYSFSSGDVDVFDENGNVISTIEGSGAGTYKFTVLNTAGEEFKNALLGNWGTIGYPLDLTGDVKTYTYTWNTDEDSANLLLGVSNVYEDFIIRVERTGDYVSDQPEIVFEDYVNVHTPGAFTVPAGEKVEFDINKTYNLVADSNGVYHLDTVDGPVVYVDMINDVMDLYGAYHNAYGAVALRGIYTNDLGVTCGYEFFGAMEAYANALDAEGYYPMTVDLREFITAFGTAQGWFSKDYTPYTEIVNGGNPESYWLIEAFYVISGAGNNGSETNGTETNAPETNVPGADSTETNVPNTDAPDANVPGTDSTETNLPNTDAPDANVPGTDSTETNVPGTDIYETGVSGTDTPETNVPGTDEPGVNVPGTDAPDANVPGADAPEADVPGADSTETNVPGTDTPDVNVPGVDAPEADSTETSVPGTDTPDANVPGADAPDANVPGADSADTNAPDADTPDVNVPGADVPETSAPETDAPIAGAPEENTPDSDAPVAGNPETDAPETEVLVEDVVIDPVVGEESGDIKLPILSNGDIANSTKLTYTFEFNTSIFEFKGIIGLDKSDYTVEFTANGVVITITNVSKVAAAKAGTKIFELVVTPKVEGANADQLNLKVEYKNEKPVGNGLGTAPNKAPATGDNMLIVVVVSIVASLGFVVLRRRESF